MIMSFLDLASCQGSGRRQDESSGAAGFVMSQRKYIRLGYWSFLCDVYSLLAKSSVKAGTHQLHKRCTEGQGRK